METKNAVQLFDDFLAHLEQVRQRVEVAAAPINAGSSDADAAEETLTGVAEVTTDMSAWSAKATAIASQVEAELGRSATALEEFLMETEALLCRWRSVHPSA